MQNQKNTPAFQVSFEPTPNPAAMRFLLGRTVLIDAESPFAGLDCQTPFDAEKSPLAAKIFGFPWTAAVFIGHDFITVTKQDWVEWEVLATPLSGLIREHLEQGAPIVLLETATNETAGTTPAPTDLIGKIMWVLDHEIRPSVAMDGGDIQFLSFEEGILTIKMKGACSGCPSSQVTLKEGIEKHLRGLFSEVLEVRAG